jgi:tetratricopeptide (TPR) repeat protein
VCTKTYATLLADKFRKTKDNSTLDAAFSAYDMAIGLDPNNATAYSNRGEAYWAKRDWDHAIADYSKAIELDPKATIATIRTCAYKGRGDAYLAKGDRNLAIKDYAQAVEFDSQAIQRDAKSAPLWNYRC